MGGHPRADGRVPAAGGRQAVHLTGIRRSRRLRPAAVLYRLHVGKDFQVETLPTVGFNVETVRVGKLTLNMWVRPVPRAPRPRRHLPRRMWRLLNADANAQDVGGQDRLRPYWRHYFTGTQVRPRRGPAAPSQVTARAAAHRAQGVMFVVDSADRSRLELAREEFAATVTDGQLEVRGGHLRLPASPHAHAREPHHGVGREPAGQRR